MGGLVLEILNVVQSPNRLNAKIPINNMLYLADGFVFTCICRTQINSYIPELNKSGNFDIFCLYFVIFSTTQAKANSKNRYQQADL